MRALRLPRWSLAASVRRLWTRAGSQQSALPNDILAELIDSLFAPLGSLIVAFSCGVFIAALISARTGDPNLWRVAILMNLVAAYRVAVIVSFRSHDVRLDDARQLRFWTWSYAIGAVSYAACFGALCSITIAQTDDAVSQLLIGSTTVGYSAGVTARNSGLVRLAILQLIVAVGPIALGAALKGSFAYFALALVDTLYLFAAIEIALFLSKKNLKLLLLNRENLMLAHDLAEQIERFDSAVSNMSHGLCMFDAQARLVVTNERVCELFGMPPGSITPGMRAAEMVGLSLAAGNNRQSEVAELAQAFEEHVQRDGAARFKLRLVDGRTVLLTRRSQERGGSVVILEDITERERAEAHAQYLLTHDMLTGLPNRLKFEDVLADAVDEARRGERRFCVMFVDLDRFKFINDTLGHAAGDLLLKEVATRLEACVDDNSFVARLGGDEFVVLKEIGDEKDAARFAGQVVQSLSRPIFILGQECITGASIGVAICPDDAADAQGLVKRADAAMYLAKQQGKNRYRMFASGVETQSVERLEFENELRHALERDEFELHYQPRKHIATGAIVGAEALLRWRHPQRGTIAPGAFIPVAEETGLIVPIGKWVVETACAQNMAWIAAGLPELLMSVNLSPRQFSHEHLLRDIETALRLSHMPSHLLELEITESILMHDLAKSDHLLRAIRDLGAHVAIDDFGTGYSSMSRLKTLSIDTIKIDRSFVNGVCTEEKDRAIAEAVIALGRALKLTIVAEGVETAEQEAYLGQQGCEQMQGFLFARPMPAPQLLDFVRNYNLGRIAQLSRGVVDQPRARAVSF